MKSIYRLLWPSVSNEMRWALPDMAVNSRFFHAILSHRVSNLRPTGHMWLRMAVNAAQHKIINLLKTLWEFFVITCHNVFNVWPKTTLLSVWPRDTKGRTPLQEYLYKKRTYHLKENEKQKQSQKRRISLYSNFENTMR